MSVNLDIGWSHYLIILDESYRIITIIEDNKKIYHENRVVLFERLQLQMYEIKEYLKWRD